MNTMPLIFRNILPIVSLLVMATSVHAEDEALVGWIDGLNGPSDAFAILRGREMIQGSVLQPVQEGDWIVIRNDGYSLELGLGNNEKLKLIHAQTPYLVISNGEPPTLAENLIRSFMSLFSADRREHGVERVESMVIRTYEDPEDLEIPLLNSGNRQLVGETGALTIVWQGGRPPFTARVFADGQNAAVVEQDGIDEARVRLGVSALKPGDYRFEITGVTEPDDDFANSAQAGFTVVDRSRIPQMPVELRRELDSSTMNDDTKAVLYGVWLAGEDKERWKLQAYQSIALLPPTYHPAFLLEKSLTAAN